MTRRSESRFAQIRDAAAEVRPGAPVRFPGAPGVGEPMTYLSSALAKQPALRSRVRARRDRPGFEGWWIFATEDLDDARNWTKEPKRAEDRRIPAPAKRPPNPKRTTVAVDAVREIVAAARKALRRLEQSKSTQAGERPYAGKARPLCGKGTA